MVAATFIKKGFNVTVEKDAGVLSNFSNADYEAVGAKIEPRDKVFSSGDMSYLIDYLNLF